MFVHPGGSSDLIGGFADFSSPAASASLPTSTGTLVIAFLTSECFHTCSSVYLARGKQDTLLCFSRPHWLFYEHRGVYMKLYRLKGKPIDWTNWQYVPDDDRQIVIDKKDLSLYSSMLEGYHCGITASDWIDRCGCFAPPGFDWLYWLGKCFKPRPNRLYAKASCAAGIYCQYYQTRLTINKRAKFYVLFSVFLENVVHGEVIEERLSKSKMKVTIIPNINTDLLCQLLLHPMETENLETGTPSQPTHPLRLALVPPSPSPTCLAACSHPQPPIPPLSHLPPSSLTWWEELTIN